MRLYFDTIFKALQTHTETVEAITGTDSWRNPTGKRGVLHVAPELMQECPRPPSKANGVFTGGKDSVWHMLHFRLLFPGLKALGQKAREEDKLQDIFIDYHQAQNHLGYFNALKSHLGQLHEWSDKLPEILGNLPENSDDLTQGLAELLEGEIKQPPNNHIVGRLLQAYYGDKIGDYERFGIEPRAQKYIEGGGRNLFERTKMYALCKLEHCPLPTDDNGRVTERIAASDILSAYTWIASPHIVEMVHPQMEGAAIKASRDLVDFLNDLYVETGGDVDFRSFEVDPRIKASLEKETDLLSRVGRMSAIADTIEEDSNLELMDIAKQIWSDEQRMAVWGSPDRYEPREDEKSLFGIIELGSYDEYDYAATPV